ncbi:MAG: glycoside hydrolase [Butyrivibrio sp.]|jgi:xylan 1,4-beta-xylosidase|nr:glycoside hydrolase [Butyrivibrio sp.]
MDLLTAIEKNDLTVIRELLVNEPTMIDAKTFFAAGKKGDLDVIRYLVEYSRISLNEVDDQNRNILHYAAFSDNDKTFEYLIDRCGMSPFVGDVNRVTPWDIAVSQGSEHIVSFLEKKYNSKLEDYYRNPIRTGMFPDPSIVRVGEDYYMVNSSFIFFPCIPISHSRDLIHWEIIGHAITNPEWAGLDELEGGRGYWAPDISYYEGRFYITATYRLNDAPPTYRRQIVVSSERPEGPYSEPSFIDEDGIDPSIFNDDDGRRYMLLNRGARILELSSDATRQISEATLLYYGDNKRAPEGPHIIKKDGYYYLFMAEGGTGIGHKVTVARSTSLMGVYEPSPYNPIMTQIDPGAALQRCGHGDLVDTTDGRWYMVYLCGRMYDKKYSLLGRETAIDPVEWTSDGWPIVNHGDGPSCMNLKPLPEVVNKFDNVGMSVTGLPLDFMTPRPFEAGAVKCYMEDGRLSFSIKGSSVPLSSKDSRNIVVRRQSDFDFNASVVMDIPQQMQEGQFAGLTGYYDENTWMIFGVTCRNGQNCIFECEHIGDDDKIFYGDNVGSAKSITLKMFTKGLERKLVYSLDGDSDKELTTLGNVYYLCDEGIKRGKRFTGATIGMAVYRGDGELTIDFSDFLYEKM